MPKEYKTKFKDSIMSYLQENQEKCITANDIYVHMQAKGEQVNLTTVYRNLEKLAEGGLLIKYKTAGQDCCQYQYAAPHAHCQEHIHMQCRSCGKILHLGCSFMEEISAHLLEHHRFLLECNGSLLTGLCEECRKRLT